MLSESLIVEETISKFLEVPPMLELKLKIGKSVWLEDNVYTSVDIPPIVLDSLGLPISCPVWFAAFKIAVNCSL